jgi:hypothetical protein
MFKRNNVVIAMEVVLVVFIFVQMRSTWKNYINPQITEIKKYGLVSSVQRSEILTLERDKARFLRFLDAYIPKDAPLVLPYSMDFFNSQSVMQYYLFPRPILACCGYEINDRCLKCLQRDDTFVPALKHYPGAEWMRGKVFVSYPSSDGNLLGVYVPVALASKLPVPTLEEYGHTEAISIRSLVIDIVILSFFFLLGFVAVLTILSNPQWIELLGLSIPLAIGLFSWMVFIISYFGIPITLFSVSACYLVTLVVFLVAYYLQYGFSLHPPKTDFKRFFLNRRGISKGILIFLGSIAVIWFILSVVVSIGRAYSLFDDIANWSLKGYAMVSTGSIFAGNRWGGHVMAYPMNLALTIGTFRLAEGDILPGSKALFPIFAGSLLLGCFGFLRNYISDRTALLGGLLIATMPLFFIHSTIGMANLPFTYYLVLGTLSGLQGFLKNEDRYLLLSGLLFALSGWTRPEGIGFASVMIVSLVLIVIFIWHKRPKFTHLALLFTPLVIIPGSWYVLIGSKSQYEDQIGTSIRESLQQIIQGNFHLNFLKQILEYGARYFFSNWTSGYVVVIAIIALLASLPFLRWYKNRLSISLIFLSLVAGLMPAGLFYVASFHEKEFSAFLDQSFDRAYLPAIVLIFVTALITALGKREVIQEA